MREKRFNAEMADRLDSSDRLVWLPPAEVVAALRVQPGEAIADVGAGTGYFTLPLARATGLEGTVYAVDAQGAMQERLRQRLTAPEFANIALVEAEAEHTGLPENGCDLVLLANVWHELDGRAVVAREVMRILKPGGRVAILDWRLDVEPVAGPPLAHRLSAAEGTADLLAAGFERIETRSVGAYSWLAVGYRPKES